MELKEIHDAKTTEKRSIIVSAVNDQQQDLAIIGKARQALQQAGDYLIYDDGDRLRIMALISDWARVGRSLAADVSFEDSTVSRRHALIVRDHDGGLHLLDDSSLNGVLVAGQRIDRHRLTDGDQFIVGRYRIHFVSVLP